MSKTIAVASAQERLAAYRAHARTLSPKASTQAISLSERIAKFAASVPAFAEDVVAVYKCERAARQ